VVLSKEVLRAVGGTSGFALFCSQAARLCAPAVDAWIAKKDLTDSERLCFLLNLYNLMTLHGMVGGLRGDLRVTFTWRECLWHYACAHTARDHNSTVEAFPTLLLPPLRMTPPLPTHAACSLSTLSPPLPVGPSALACARGPSPPAVVRWCAVCRRRRCRRYLAAHDSRAAASTSWAHPPAAST